MKSTSILLTAFILICSCSDPLEKSVRDIPVASLSLSESSIELFEGGTYLLSASILPTNASDKIVYWSSSDPKIASVDQGGVVLARSAGSTTIKASAGGKFTDCLIRVMRPVERVSLNKSELRIAKGYSEKVFATTHPDDYSSKYVTWFSDDDKIATVDSDGLVYAVKEGTTSVRAKIGDKEAICKVIVMSSWVPTPEAIDLGLSVKWASFNLGANAPEECGNYYAWGETEIKDRYYHDTYRNSQYDSKTMKLEDDVAHVKLGGNWRIPSKDEVTELISTLYNSNYRWSQITINGRRGWEIVYLGNGNHLFIPATGHCDRSSISLPDREGMYWTSSLYVGSKAYCYTFSLGSYTREYIRIDYTNCYYGLAIRPVSD